MSNLPTDYVERIYAGVLGKVIGVYLGRPIEGMLRKDIESEFGTIESYVHESRNSPLVVTDDDISGTFTFLRALEDFPVAGRNLTSAQIGATWLNYIIEKKTILWWGGVGMSTEHTAFHRLKQGIAAPMSGSTELNSKVVAEQIGAQIFIDGWGMVSPGDPEMAAAFAEQAAKVSHDGEAVYAAQVIAAMEAAAFTESNTQRLIDIGVSFIPKDSVIYNLISDLRESRSREPDWRRTMIDLVERKYGYDRYGGNCHVIPNHALIILALLYGEDDFQKSLMIANTCGWDTDCNSGNVGCLLGIKNGLKGIGSEWRDPVADRIFLPTAEGGSCITDAISQTYRIANMGRKLAGHAALAPKENARFHFSLPGSVQGWKVDEHNADFENCAQIANHHRQLAIHFESLSSIQVARVCTPTFASLKELKSSGYGMFACPTLYPGQEVMVKVAADQSNSSAVAVRPYVNRIKKHDKLASKLGDPKLLEPGESAELRWLIPDFGGYPIQDFGIEICGLHPGCGRIFVDSVAWGGSPTFVLGNSHQAGIAGIRQWIEACDRFSYGGKTSDDQAYVAIQNEGRGMAICGTRDWNDYRVSANLTAHLAAGYGIAARVQGLRRYYALLLIHPNRARLVKVLNTETILLEADFDWHWNDDPHAFALDVRGMSLKAFVDQELIFEFEDTDPTLNSGAIALVVEEGRVGSSPVAVMANSNPSYASVRVKRTI